MKMLFIISQIIILLIDILRYYILSDSIYSENVIKINTRIQELLILKKNQKINTRNIGNIQYI